MKRATITIPDELQDALEQYARRQDEPPELSAVVQTALREFLERQEELKEREFRPLKITPREEKAEPEDQEFRPFRITPASKGSGLSDVSINHDKYFAEASYDDSFNEK